MKTFSFLIITSVALLVACTPKLNPYAIYKPIDVEKVYQLQADSVSRQQVEQLFGQPLTRSINNRGDLYTYSYFGDSLFIQFNREQVVARFNYLPEVFTTNFENFDNTNRKFSNAKLKKIEPGVSRLQSMNSLFGKPNKGEQGVVRYRTSFYGKDGKQLIVYSTLHDGFVISYELK